MKNRFWSASIMLLAFFLIADAGLFAESTIVRVGFSEVPGIYSVDAAGKRAGYFHDLLMLIAGRLGWEIQYTDASRENSIRLLYSGEIDLLGYVARDMENNALFDYSSEAVIAGWSTVLVHAPSGYSRLENLKGMTVALVRGMSESDDFLRLIQGAGISIVPLYADDISAQLKLFGSAKAEAIVVSSNLIPIMLKEGGFIHTGLVFAPHACSFAVKKGSNSDLLTAIDLELHKIKSESPQVLEALAATYLDPPRKTEFPAWIWIALLVLASLAGVFSFFAVSLRFQVRKQTAILQRQKDELTAQASRMEEVNRELEAFSYSVSHDLRAPLRSIQGYSKIILEDYSAGFDEECSRLFTVIGEAAGKMSKLIEGLLKFSHLSVESADFSLQDMRDLVKAVFADMTSPETRGRIDFRLEAMAPAWMDPVLMRQAWTNLISNAIKYSSKVPKALIEAGSEEVEGQVEYYIRDNGCGFDMRYYDKLFRAFQRMHDSRDFEGTGLGLALVKRIITRHGGRIWAVGEAGKGATFRFTLGRRT